MKKIFALAITVFVFLGCKKDSKTSNYNNQELNVTTSIYPEPISKVFDAHGGIDRWNMMQGLYFEIPRLDFTEKQFMNLKSREARIEYKHHILGYDGENVWLKNLDTLTYKKNPRFYYNLMSYFYAMPFILGDDGINYETGPELEYDGRSYPGILISYEAGIGESPEDEYIVFYDPETFKMEWLAYTVTFFTNEKAKSFKLIKYDEWEEVNGLQLPKSLQWYAFEDGDVGAMQNELLFQNAMLSKDQPEARLFEAEEGAQIIE